MKSQTSIANKAHKPACTSSRGAAGASPNSLQLLLLVDVSRAVAMVTERLQSAALLPGTVPQGGRAKMSVSDSTATSQSCSTPSPGSSSSSEGSSKHIPPLPFTGFTSSPSATATDENTSTSSLLQTAVSVGMQLMIVLAEWHEKVTDAADAAKQAAGPFNGLSAPQPLSAVAGAAAAGRPVLQVAGSTGCEVPRWLSKLSQQGLPGTVAGQLQLMSFRWMPELLKACLSKAAEPGEEVRCGGACQQQLQQGLGASILCPSCREGLCRQYLGDMMQVINTLLDEVPLPLGCSNPACVNLEGESEAAASHRACNGCKVACYCSTACQKAHRKRHKAVCQCLQEQVQPT